MMLGFSVPIRTTTGLNAREHWAKRHARVKRERGAAMLFFPHAEWRNWKPKPSRLVVTLTRVGPRLCDSDNVQGGLKAIRDEVAFRLGFDDSPSSPIRWEYAQRKGDWAVEVTIMSDQVSCDGCSNGITESGARCPYCGGSGRIDLSTEQEAPRDSRRSEGERGPSSDRRATGPRRKSPPPNRGQTR